MSTYFSAQREPWGLAKDPDAIDGSRGVLYTWPLKACELERSLLPLHAENR